MVEAIPTSRHGERGCFHVSREVIRRSPGKGGRHPESITKRKDTVVPWGNLEPVNRIFSGGRAVTKSGSKACQLHPTGENVGSVAGNSPIGGSWVEKAGSEGPNVRELSQCGAWRPNPGHGRHQRKDQYRHETTFSEQRRFICSGGTEGRE